ncbi:MAG: hypothetical protein JSR24_09495 [Proteobacteria bacterium]|nr:hypothetical protein [Pseudomonadota bacterium]
MIRHFPAAIAAVVLSLASLDPAAAQGQQFNVGDRVHIGLNNDNGTVVEVQTQLANGGWMVKIKRDSNGLTLAYDTVASNVTLQGGGGGGVAPTQ